MKGKIKFLNKIFKINQKNRKEWGWIFYFFFLIIMTSFAVDTTGSFIRPEVLMDARSKHEKKEISDLELQKIEDEEIKKLVDKQVAAGLKVVGDGEFRRWGYFYLINFLIFNLIYLFIFEYYIMLYYSKILVRFLGEHWWNLIPRRNARLSE
jgi:hypothetical protein